MGCGRDDDKDEFGEAGAPCSICCSDLRTNTHFAVPCRHAACESCWATWLEQHDTCMICAKPVRSTARFSQRLAPPSPAEAACDPGATASGGGAAAAAIAALNNDLEGALAALVRALVSARSALGGVAGRLDEMAAHLDPPRLRLMPPEARASVAAVEASALEELLGDARPGDAAPWQAIRSSVAGVDQALARVGGVLDDMPAGQGAARPSLAPALEVMQALLLDTSPRILTGQWRPTVLAPPHAARSGAPGAGAPDTRRGARGAEQEALARVVCEERLQRVVDLLDLSGALEAETARWVRRSRSLQRCALRRAAGGRGLTRAPRASAGWRGGAGACAGGAGRGRGAAGAPPGARAHGDPA